MSMKRYFIGLLAAVLCAGCSESLEDTYADWVGDGKIRYVAKCSNIEIVPGWERLSVTWKNGVDASVEHIKLAWSAGGVKDSILLQPTDTAYDIRDLADASYRVDVNAVANDGTESLPITSYGRPYTESHEILRTFTQGILKSYWLTDINTLVYWADIFDESQIIDMKLYYMGTDGEQHERDGIWSDSFWDFDKYDKQTLMDIPNVRFDEGDSIYITRIGLLDACPDTIYFEPLVLANSRTYTSDFKMAIERRYGISSDSTTFNAFIDTVRVLEFDYDITSFEDVLYCPKLEKIVLGKNRYINPEYPATSVLRDEYRSEKVLDMANDLRGVTIERYGDHYFEDDEPRYCTTIEGYPSLPTNLEYITTSAIDTIICSEDEIIGHDSRLEDLFDNDPTTYWETWPQADARTYTVTVTLNEAQQIDGFKVQQANVAAEQPYFPNQLELQVSNDQVNWKKVTFVLSNIIGQGVGEATLLPMAEPGAYKYFRFTITDQTQVNLAAIRLAELVPYVVK